MSWTDVIRISAVYRSASQSFSDCGTLKLDYFFKLHPHITICKFHVLVYLREPMCRCIFTYLGVSDYLGQINVKQ